MGHYALVADRIWDGLSDTTQERVAVIVKGAEIEAIAPLDHLPPHVPQLHLAGCTLIPGLIDLEETDQKLRNERAQNSPLHRIVTPAELGLLCVALCSPAFASVTGEALLADAGFWLKHF